MLHYDKIDFSKGIDLTKSSNSKECMVCHYWFFNHGFKYEDSVCNTCHDFLIQWADISNIAIVTVKVAGNCYIIYSISKSNAII